MLCPLMVAFMPIHGHTIDAHIILLSLIVKWLMSNIFISYRRSDSSGYVIAIYERLIQKF